MKAVLWVMGFLMTSWPVMAQDVPWRLATMDGVAVAFSATIDLSQDGRISGQAPCNRYFADLTTELPEFKPGPIGATEMACADLGAEAEFFALLAQMDLAEVVDADLVLTGAGHQMNFVRK